MDKYSIHPDPMDYQIGREEREGGKEGGRKRTIILWIRVEGDVRPVNISSVLLSTFPLTLPRCFPPCSPMQ